jgi:multiple sugar transport system substrate-binding protein
MSKHRVVILGGAGAALVIASLGGAVSAQDAPSGSIRYTLWDSNQLPAYQACEAAFEAANPAIDVTIEQLGWDDYWNGITTGFVSGTAPDVFTNHLAKYPEFASSGTILPLNDWIARDAIDTSVYFPGLADLWKTPDGNVYGLPKDFDTIAFAYNTDLLEAAGVDAATLTELTWNPTDGGTFEQLIAKLTVDSAGVRGDEEGFNKDDVAVYGLALENSGGAYGQTQWSFLSHTNGFEYMDQPQWGTVYNYDSDALVQTLEWWRGLIEKGYMPSLESTVGSGYLDVFGAGKYAMASVGSWQIGDVKGREVPTGFFPTPIGPSGARSSMFNGLADSISATTANPEAAWAWVKFLASADCQNLVGESAVVFPAIASATEIAKAKRAEIASATEIAKAKRAEQGVDVSAFTTHVENGTTFTFPIADHASDIAAIMSAAMDQVLSFQGGSVKDVLSAANAEVNALFQ